MQAQSRFSISFDVDDQTRLDAVLEIVQNKLARRRVPVSQVLRRALKLYHEALMRETSTQAGVQREAALLDQHKA